MQVLTTAPRGTGMLQPTAKPSAAAPHHPSFQLRAQGFRYGFVLHGRVASRRHTSTWNNALGGANNAPGLVWHERGAVSRGQKSAWSAGANAQGHVLGLVNNEAPDITLEPVHEEKQQKETEMQEMVDKVRAMLSSMNDGEISISAYDTAWVALVKDLAGGEGPQFPSSVDWIVGNQLPDGSWGDDAIFLIHDQMINTLGCVIALTSWNIHADKCKKGLSFIRENMWRLANEEEEWMPIGFEIAFPSLLGMARDLGLDIPYDDPALQEIYAKRDLKLNKIPKDVMHSVPTTLLHSIEGMPGLDWKRLLKLQCQDGSFLFSPAATAYALMQTGDEKCLEYLDRIVRKFDGGVPNVYPVDLFENIWAVDRLERLGISRFFEREIEQCLDHVYRHWTEVGICWARNSEVQDVDDTAMGFRLLRQHGYNVSPGVFKRFEKDGGFICFAGQSNQAVTGMYNLNRAAQVAFPGEDILERANAFSRAYLQEMRAANKLHDKWIIAKDLPGEVMYAMDFPWKASLPRVETRLYLEQYGGSADVWIGKSLYRMPLVNNDLYLKMAKADFSDFQRRCRLECKELQKWYEGNGLQKYGVTAESVLRAYFLAAANIFEPGRAVERLGWARTAVLADAVSSYFRSNACTEDMREELISDFVNHDYDNLARWAKHSTDQGLLFTLQELIDIVAYEATVQTTGNQNLRIHRHANAFNDLREAWKQWFMAWTGKNRVGSCEEKTSLLLVRTIEICSGSYGSAEHKLDSSEYSRLEQLTSSICHQLATRVLAQDGANNEAIEKLDRQVDAEMQELVQCALQSYSGIDKVTRQTFLSVVKSFYYTAHCSPETIDRHVSIVMFEDVV